MKEEIFDITYFIQPSRIYKIAGNHEELTHSFEDSAGNFFKKKERNDFVRAATPLISKNVFWY